jgi:hypothetical protein
MTIFWRHCCNLLPPELPWAHLESFSSRPNSLRASPLSHLPKDHNLNSPYYLVPRCLELERINPQETLTTCRSMAGCGYHTNKIYKEVPTYFAREKGSVLSELS